MASPKHVNLAKFRRQAFIQREDMCLTREAAQELTFVVATAQGLPIASEVAVLPAGGIAETDVQGALEGLDANKQPKAAILTALSGTTTASRLIGRGAAAGAGQAQEIQLGPGLSMAGTTLNVTASVPSYSRTFMLMGG